MESLISVVNQLQDVCNAATLQLPIDLPQIVVIGTQSSGKSSVIESFVKREFLPKGTGIVTRTPLVIRLFKTNDGDTDDEYVIFRHSPKVFKDFNEVREEIESETRRLCGSNKGICSEPITLGIYSKNVVDLTLVDLPGFTKIAVDDQPQDIEIQIRDLVIEYIKNPNSIILAVSAATSDFTTSEAIKIAREVDSDGLRTLAVITKLDMVEPSPYTIEVLTGRVIKIRLGIIGVVNRSEHDVSQRKSIQKAIEDEAKFFSRLYPTIADKHGQPHLSKKLSQLLMRHIRHCLPELEVRISSLTSQYQAQLDSYGHQITDKAEIIMNIVNKFALSYCEAINGGNYQVGLKELCGGARIRYILKNSFGTALSGIDPLDDLDSKAILTAARNIAGTKPTISVDDTFEMLIARQIKRLREPGLQCVTLVHQEMLRLFKCCGPEVQLDLTRFPNLRAKFEEVFTRLLDERLPVTREAVEDLVTYNSDQIDTDDYRVQEAKIHAFYGTASRAGVDSKSEIGEDNFERDRELRECDAIARMIKAYFNKVREEMKIYVRKAIISRMVIYVKTHLQPALMKASYQESLFDELLSESDEIIQKRRETAEMLVALKKASEIMNNIGNQK